MVFFYISAPLLLGSREATIKQLRETIISRGLADGGQLSLTHLAFKMANLDTLMFCNDKTLKMENNIEALLKKIDKQYLDLTEKNNHEWWVKGEKELPAKKYFSQFLWNDSKFPVDKPITHIINLFESRLATVENLLRTNTTQYNQAKAQLNQLTQKEGNYNVKDLNEVIVEPHVKAKDFHYTRFVATVVCVVPAVNIENFKLNYWKVSNYVIPNSANQLKIPQKDGLTLWTVDIFNQKLQQDNRDEQQEEEHDIRDPKKHVKKQKKYANPIAEFIDKARDRLKITVREFKFQTNQSKQRKEKRDALSVKLQAHTTTLKEILKTQFSEAFELYIHTKVVRMVIQSRMRFGSDKTVYYWLEPVQSKEKAVQTTLVSIFGDKESDGLYGTKDEIDDGEDFFPFIYVPGMTF